MAGLVRNHINPTLDPVKLKDLSPANLRGMYRAKLDSGLSGKTVAYVHVNLYSALGQAVADGLIPHNPVATVKPPRMDQQEMIILSPTQP